MGSVERCYVEADRLLCKCGRFVAKDPKPWSRDRSSVMCENCKRKIHASSGLVVGQAPVRRQPDRLPFAA